MFCHVYILVFTHQAVMILGKPSDKASIDSPVLLQTSQKGLSFNWCQKGFPLIEARRREAFSKFFYMSYTCMILLPASLCSWCCCNVQDWMATMSLEVWSCWGDSLWWLTAAAASNTALLSSSAVTQNTHITSKQHTVPVVYTLHENPVVVRVSHLILTNKKQVLEK